MMARTFFAAALLAALVFGSAALAQPAAQTPALPPSMSPAEQAATPAAPPVAEQTGAALSAPAAQPESPTAPPSAPAEDADVAEESSGDGTEPGTVKLFHDIEFVWIPAGSFVPGLEGGAKKVVTVVGGREEWFSDESVRPKEKISQGFWMSKTEITRRQWGRVMGSQPWAEHNADDQLDVPATWVTWKDAAAFAKTLSQENESACRLPTENEWEYACRAKTSTLYPFGDDPAGLDEYAWYRGTAPDGVPRPVAQKKPNAWGLCDMLGNAWEWCADVYSAESTTEGHELRVIRGGAANQPATFNRPTVRMGRSATEAGARVGFRIVREP